MGRVLKIAVIGAGRIGKLHAENIHRHARATIAAVYDVDARARGTLASRYGAIAAESLTAAIDAADALMICSPTDTHVEIIGHATRARRAIFCEKPIDLDLRRVDACLESVERAKVPLMIGFNRRFDPHFRALRSALLGGSVGTLEMLKITSRDPAPPPPAYVAASGGIFRDMMIHDLDLARFLLGRDEPRRIFAVGSCLVDPAIGEAGDVDTAMVTIETKAGRLCHIDNSRRAVYGYDQRVEAFCASGMLLAENPRPTTLRRFDGERVTQDKPPYFFLERYAEAYRAELDHFVAVVVDGLPAEVDGEDGRAALRLADAAARSLAGGRPITLEAPP